MLVVKEQSALVLKYLVLLSAPQEPQDTLMMGIFWQHVLAAPWPDGVSSYHSICAPFTCLPCLEAAPEDAARHVTRMTGVISLGTIGRCSAGLLLLSGGTAMHMSLPQAALPQGGYNVDMLPAAKQHLEATWHRPLSQAEKEAYLAALRDRVGAVLASRCPLCLPTMDSSCEHQHKHSPG